MKTFNVAVGSTRAPKVNAVRQTLAHIGNLSGAHSTLAAGENQEHIQRPHEVQFEVIGVEVESGVGHTPQSRAETMAGARRRAEALMVMAWERSLDWSYFVGLEGGLDVVHEKGHRWAFLENWAFVKDAAGRECYGQAGGIALPDRRAEEVIDRGVELGVAIDAYAGGLGIRDAQGAWGVLTSNLISREEAYRIALIHAFAPFFNPRIYP